MLALAHVRMRVLSLLRTPAYVVGTLAMPSLILVFLGVGLAGTTVEANAIMASFTVFAVMGIAFFQFGVGIAAHRTSPWATFERILPASIAVRLAGAVVPAVLFAAAAAGLVVLVAHLFMPVALDAAAWLQLGLVLLAGSVPLSLLGVAIRVPGVFARGPAGRQRRLSRPRVRRGPVRAPAALPRLPRCLVAMPGLQTRRRAGLGSGRRCALAAGAVALDRMLHRRRLPAGRLGLSPG